VLSASCRGGAVEFARAAYLKTSDELAALELTFILDAQIASLTPAAIVE
jgi:hypothetical protein